MLAFSSLAGAQSAPIFSVAERPMLWGGLASELVLPGLSVGASVPLKSSSPTTEMAVRGSVETFVVPFIPEPQDGGIPLLPLVLNADLLFSEKLSGSGIKVYGGPNVGTIHGLFWGVGGVVGARNTFGSSKLGWYAEGKAQYFFGNSLNMMVPGVRLGLTYRF